MKDSHLTNVYTPSPRGGLGVGTALFILLLLASCGGGHKGQLRIQGRFDNLPQADLLLYSPDGGLSTIDTLHIVKGKFDYRTAMADDDPHTFVIVYPNFATLSFMARAGQTVRIKGDALALAQVSVEGADSIVQPTERPNRQALKVGKRLPKNDIIPRPKGKYLLVAFTADWRMNAASVEYDIRRALGEHPDSLHAFSYKLDLEPKQTPQVAAGDSARWHSYCDYKGWASPLLTRLGIRNIPLLLLLDPDGKVLALGSKYAADIQPALQKIKD